MGILSFLDKNDVEWSDEMTEECLKVNALP